MSSPALTPPLPAGHRFRPAYDFDYVALDLLSVYPVDAGMYTCRATNRLGQAVTSASVRVIGEWATMTSLGRQDDVICSVLDADLDAELVHILKQYGNSHATSYELL